MLIDKEIISEGKSLKDSESLKNLGSSKETTLYLKDLGPQVGWTTVRQILFVYTFVRPK